MRCSLLLPLAGLLVAAVCDGTLAGAEPGYKLSAVTDRPDGLYSVGERARFLVTLKRGDEPVAGADIAYVLSKDGAPPVTQGKLRLVGGAGSVEGTLVEPGFLRFQATYAAEGQPAVTALAGASFDALKIRPSLPAPKDFDAFWRAQKRRLREVPLKPALTPVASPVAGVECFAVEIPCVPPRPVRGYFALPAGAARKSLPAVLYVHAAGVYSSSLPNAAGQARDYGALSLDFNAHGIADGQPAEFYKALGDGELAGYPFFGREDREQCYFVGMFLRLARAMEFLTSRPEWDGKVLVVHGSSQGGGQALAAAGLDRRVTLISAGVPAICDHTGAAGGRTSGWPRLVPLVDGKPDPKVLEASRYVDCVNLAARSRAEALVSVGFIDGTCPPTSVYAAYNALRGRKRIVNEPLMGHEVSARLVDETRATIKAHIAATR